MASYILGVLSGVSLVLILSGLFLGGFSKESEIELMDKTSNPIEDKPIYHGASSYYRSIGTIYLGDRGKGAATIMGGTGRISGIALLDGRPLSGLKLRLFLNMEAFSQWVETDENGLYTVNVPFGSYSINGYEFDIAVANDVLSGKVLSANSTQYIEKIFVNETDNREGLEFEFLTPIEKYTTNAIFDAEGEVLLKWASVDNAKYYGLHITAKKQDIDEDERYIIGWPDIPKLKTNQINISKYINKFPTGYVFDYHVFAYTGEDNYINSTARNYENFDFKLYGLTRPSS